MCSGIQTWLTGKIPASVECFDGNITCQLGFSMAKFNTTQVVYSGKLLMGTGAPHNNRHTAKVKIPVSPLQCNPDPEDTMKNHIRQLPLTLSISQLPQLAPSLCLGRSSALTLPGALGARGVQAPEQPQQRAAAPGPLRGA